ncbi:MAG: hypothetical protein NXI31_11500 [bacterium]|nr:hypothetical protein [bacterium]
MTTTVAIAFGAFVILTHGMLYVLAYGLQRQITHQLELYRTLADRIDSWPDEDREWSECSGDPSSCPENEGYGCCGGSK